MHGIYELVKAKFVKEMVGLLSVSIEDRGFFPLEWFVIPPNQIWVLRALRRRPWRRCWRRWFSERFLRGFWVRCCRSELVSCWKGPRESVTCRRCHFRWSCWLCRSSDGPDFTLCLVIRPSQVIVDISDSFQSFFDVIDWAGFGW